jgi:hypothetical protein
MMPVIKKIGGILMRPENDLEALEWCRRNNIIIHFIKLRYEEEARRVKATVPKFNDVYAEGATFLEAVQKVYDILERR